MAEKDPTPDEQPDGHASVDTDAQVAAQTDEGPGPAGQAPVGEGPPSNGTSAAAGSPPASVSSSNGPTTEVHPQPGGASRVDGPSRPEMRPVEPVRPPAPPRAGPVPAPGPVPGPGPDADAPPPWRRIPGRDGPGPDRREPVAAMNAPRTGAGPQGGSPRSGHPQAGNPQMNALLGEGPTAFLEAPRREEQSSDAGGWSPVRASRNRPPRQAALQLRRLDPWSALKLALVLAVVLFFVWLVAVGVLYGVLDGIGVWDRLNGTYADLVSGETQTGAPLISAGRVFGFAAVIGAVNSLLFAVAVTIAAFVYNVSADLVGGVEVTLSERD